MSEKNPISKKLSYAVVMVCVLEILIVGYSFRSALPLPPEIQSYHDETDLKNQAKKIYHENFLNFPKFTKNFFGIFYFYNAEKACKDIFSPAKYWNADVALRSYNLYARPLHMTF